MGFREVGINRHIQPGRSAFDPAQHQMLHRIKADRAAFESTLYPGFNIRDLEDLQQSQNLNELTFAPERSITPLGHLGTAKRKLVLKRVSDGSVMKLRQLLLGGVHRFGVIENEKNPAATV